MVGDAILGGLPAENVVLLDLDPPGQGTYPDFAATEKLFGIRAVCPTDVTKSGRELWYERDGRKTRILRVYNRLIVDEIVEKKVASALPLHGRARRAVGGPPQLVLPLEQARAAGAAAPARARGAPA